MARAGRALQADRAVAQSSRSISDTGEQSRGAMAWTNRFRRRYMQLADMAVVDLQTAWEGTAAVAGLQPRGERGWGVQTACHYQYEYATQ